MVPKDFTILLNAVMLFEKIATNSNPTIPPINVDNLPLLPTNGDTMVYFRAFNSCSSAPAPYTSSYSNILSASCAIPAGGAYSPFTIKIVNNSRTILNYSLNSGNVFSIQNGATSSFNFSTETATINVHLVPKTLGATGDPSAFVITVAAAAPGPDAVTPPVKDVI